jgi:hypothetical protein
MSNILEQDVERLQQLHAYEPAVLLLHVVQEECDHLFFEEKA